MAESSCGACQGGNVNLGAVLQQMQQKKQVKWSDRIKEIMEEISKAKPKDRLDYAVEFTALFHALCYSVSGWGQWLGFAIQVRGATQLAAYAGFKRLTLAECQALYPQLKALVLELLKIDYELSLAKEKEGEVKEKETKKAKKKQKKTKKRSKPEVYIH